jgi:signal transduction histidine kinase
MLTETPDKILIVDDEPDIAKALKLHLEDVGYATSLASGGAAALAELKKKRDYTIILLDINMPGINGVTVLKHIRESGNNAAVIMMSGHGSEELAVECMRNGAEDYIAKPFSLSDIQGRIERASEHRKERMEKQMLQQEKEDFILMLSHDMKNPLTAVIGSIDIIREGCLGVINDEQEEYLQSAIDSCNEVVVMIDNLLDIRKFEAGKIQMAIQPYKAQELIEKVAHQFARPAKHDGIEFLVDIEPGIAEIAVDKTAFTRVLGNLLGNALKFTPEEGTIAISCHHIAGNDPLIQNIPGYALEHTVINPAGCFIKVAVRDTGNGIPHDELDRIFNRYTQFSRKTGRERGGAGLGLAYCKLAIESFQGVIWAESDNSEGSEFIILLPCCPTTN